MGQDGHVALAESQLRKFVIPFVFVSMEGVSVWDLC